MPNFQVVLRCPTYDTFLVKDAADAQEALERAFDWDGDSETGEINGVEMLELGEFEGDGYTHGRVYNVDKNDQEEGDPILTKEF